MADLGLIMGSLTGETLLFNQRVKTVKSLKHFLNKISAHFFSKNITGVGRNLKCMKSSMQCVALIDNIIHYSFKIRQ